MTEKACTPAAPAKCAVNMGMIHLQAGDLVSAYRFFEPMAQSGDTDSIERLVEICERAGDLSRAETWRSKLPGAAAAYDK